MRLLMKRNYHERMQIFSTSSATVTVISRTDTRLAVRLKIIFALIKMALANNIQVVKSFDQKRKSKSEDDHNFHVIIAPGDKKPKILNHSLAF